MPTFYYTVWYSRGLVSVVLVTLFEAIVDMVFLVGSFVAFSL